MEIRLSPWQTKVWDDPHRFRIVCAGRRSGKSVLSQLTTIYAAHENPGPYWIVAPTYRQAKQIHWQGIQELIPQKLVQKKNEIELSITLTNGSIIELKGAENPDALRGVKLRGLVIDEIASIRNWNWLWQEVLRPTLTDYQAPCLFISTPKGFNHFHDLWQLGKQPGTDYASWQFTSYDNPYVQRSEIDTAKNELPSDVFSQEYMATFTHFTGIVYKEFDPDIHVRYFDTPYDQKGDWYFGQDFGVRGFNACVVVRVDSQGHIWIVDCLKKEGMTAKDFAFEMKEMLKKYAPLDKFAGYADPAGWASNLGTIVTGMAQNKSIKEMQWSIADEFIEEGLPIVAGNNKVAPGINFVRQLFKEGKIHIHPRCDSLIDEIIKYQWLDQTESQMNTITEPEKVRKINDHLVDAMRYVLYSKPSSSEEEEEKRPTIFPDKFPEPIIEEEKEDSYEPIDFSSDYY